MLGGLIIAGLTLAGILLLLYIIIEGWLSPNRWLKWLDSDWRQLDMVAILLMTQDWNLIDGRTIKLTDSVRIDVHDCKVTISDRDFYWRRNSWHGAKINKAVALRRANQELSILAGLLK